LDEEPRATSSLCGDLKTVVEVLPLPHQINETNYGYIYERRAMFRTSLVNIATAVQLKMLYDYTAKLSPPH